MRVVFDCEANGLEAPTKIWLIVCKDIDTGKLYIFRNPSDDPTALQAFQTFAMDVSCWIGHNVLGYDVVHIGRLLGITILPSLVVDTLVISKLVNYSRKGHSIEDYGIDFGLEKIKFYDFTKWSQELETYCIRDVEVNHKVYNTYKKIIDDPKWAPAIKLEQEFQLVVNKMHDNGFAFNVKKAEGLLAKVEAELAGLNEKMQTAFPPKQVLIREFTPKATKHGTISKTSVPRALWGTIHEYEVGKTYPQTKDVPFNPSSHKQRIVVLNEAGWSPIEKTDTHIETERELSHIRYGRVSVDKETHEKLKAKLEEHKVYGWKVNETNLITLPADAPEGARVLAKLIQFESRRRTLTEWLGLTSEDGRVHGRFYGIGAWTHRMAHQQPNTANIPNEFEVGSGKAKLLGKEMRQLWCAPKNRLLIGVDAEAIQLRIFAHLIDSPELTNAIVNGKKSDKTDPHSLNQKVFGKFCKTRNSAKHSLYAIFFGGRANMIAQIMDCSKTEAEEAIELLRKKYPGLVHLERDVFPKDAKRGFFVGLDGREVPFPVEGQKDREHLCMSGYLQNGEAVVMKSATLKWEPKLIDFEAMLVDLVHDEWQTEGPNNLEICLKIAKMQADSLTEVGEELKLKCPLAGSYYNDDHKDWTIGPNWYETH